MAPRNAIELERDDLFDDASDNGIVPLRLSPSGERKARQAVEAGVPLLVEIDPRMFLDRWPIRV